MKTTEQMTGDGCNLVTTQLTGAGRGRLVEPLRGGRGAIGSGGGRGVLLRSGKVASSRGGLSVRLTERQRLAADSATRYGSQVAAGAVVGSVAVTLAGAGVLPLAAAMLSPYQAAGGLLGDAQGQTVLAICAAMSRKLLASMRRDGKQPSSTTGEDAAAAGVLAVARWWAINARHPGQRARGSLVAVAWRAIVRESSRDVLGDAFALDEFTAAGLAAAAVPLPAFCGDESRDDKAARVAYERARAQRPTKLSARLVSLTAASGNGRRAGAVSKVGHAAALLLGGVRLDDAAKLAGFKSSGAGRGAMRAGDALAKAGRRLGFAFQFNLRQGGRGDAVTVFERVTFTTGAGNVAVLCPVERSGGVPVAALVRSWSFAPSAGLPVQRGKLAGREVKRQARAARRARLAVDRKGKAARWAARQSVKLAGLKRAQRLASRAAKLTGGRFGAFLPAVEVDGAAVTRARLLAAWRGKVWGAV